MIVFGKDLYKAKIKNIEDKIPPITNLANKSTLNAKINEMLMLNVKYLILLTLLLMLLLMLK